MTWCMGVASDVEMKPVIVWSVLDRARWQGAKTVEVDPLKELGWLVGMLTLRPGHWGLGRSP